MQYFFGIIQRGKCPLLILLSKKIDVLQNLKEVIATSTKQTFLTCNIIAKNYNVKNKIQWGIWKCGKNT